MNFSDVDCAIKLLHILDGSQHHAQSVDIMQKSFFPGKENGGKMILLVWDRQ